MVGLEVILRGIVAVALKGRDDEVIAVSEDAAAAVLESGTDPTGLVPFDVLLAVSVLSE